MDIPVELRQFEQAINLQIQQAVAAAMQSVPTPNVNVAPAAVNVNAVGVKLPDFWTSDPVMWFRQAEACFRRSNITVSGTKFDHVLMKLPEAVVISVRSLINEIQPTDNDAYERLKERLTESYIYIYLLTARRPRVFYNLFYWLLYIKKILFTLCRLQLAFRGSSSPCLAIRGCTTLCRGRGLLFRRCHRRRRRRR